MKAIRKICAVVFIAAAPLLVNSFAQQGPQPGTGSQAAARGIAVSHIDRSVRPGDDFYTYANGAWLQKTEIPADRSRVGVFSLLADRADDQTRVLVEEAAKSDAASGSNARKIADLYKSYMDEEAIEKHGMERLRPRLQAISAIRSRKDLARTLGEELRKDVDPLNNTNFHTMHLFGLWVAPGFADSEHYTAYLLQGGLALPDREYYLAGREHMREVRAKYLAHVAAIMKLAGFDNPETRAKGIVELEHAIAEEHRSLAENEDIHKANTLWTPADFAAKAPGLDWTEYFHAAGLSGVKRFDVWQPEAFTGEAALVGSQPLETWKNWLAFHLVEEYGGALPKTLADERFAFFGTVLSGASQQRPRWQRAVITVNTLLGDAVGQIYAKRYFSPEAKAEADAMVKGLIASFRKRIDELPWMAPATKAEAAAKLASLYVGIGYPEKWRDYSKYEVKPDDLFGNLWRASRFEYQYWVDRLGSGVDRHEWSMTPQTVNAVNLPLQNALNFPAAILQPPFYDPQAPAAVNFGAIGTVIGHEISHAFDTEGSTFDAQGRLRNWWTDADLKRFEEVTSALAKQYEQYRPFQDLGINGRQTLAENIADVAGLSAAYDGYHASLNGKVPPAQDGFTGDQQFFIAFAQNWASKIRPASLRQQILGDSHSPGEYRAATVRNIDAWYGVFEVHPGEKLYLAPGERVKIW